MPDIKKLKKAQKAKFDEFYTQYSDIQKEMNAYLEYNPEVFKNKTILLPCDDPEWSNFTKFFAQNFERFGLKKLISTSFAFNSKNLDVPYQLSLFESESPKYNPKKTKSHGKLFILDRDENKSGKIDIEDLKWDYLEGDGDFRSAEVKKLRDESDIIITNPPFSLFREFLSWINDAKKKFIIIGNINAISYKEVFPLLKENKVWLGPSITSGDRKFLIPKELFDKEKVTGTVETDDLGNKYVHVVGVRWYTNIDHGRRHQPLNLMSMQDNLKYSKHKQILENGYPKYDNYDGIEVPFADSIPSDYSGTMGVPISFMDKYNPEQFEILGLAPERSEKQILKIKKYENAIQHNSNGTTQTGNKVNDGPVIKTDICPQTYPYYTADNSDGYLIVLYARVLIRWLPDAPGHN